MKPIAFALRRRTEPEPATALLLPSASLAKLREVAGRLPEWPAVFATADGFLVRLPSPSRAVWPGAVRLRELAPRLLLPVDADLLPALHAHEIESLTDGRGLVFLPGGRALQFDPDEPVPVGRVATFGEVERRDWKPLRDPPERPDRIVRLQRIGGDDNVEAILEGGAPDPEGSPERPTPGPVQRGVGRAGLWLGGAMGRVGNALGLGALTRLGANVAAAALRRVPFLSREVLGQQEAALRDLLRDFREGKSEDALRRALPLGGADNRASVPASDAQLPTHGRFSLRDLLGGGGRGPASVWYGGADVQAELRHEYWRAAREAVERGDFRRAAFIHGRLLNDIREAANILSRGGLHREAAILFRDRLNDRNRAAQEFEKAGDYDDALTLYRELRDHERAGDLLTKLGEVEEATAEYVRAAELVVERLQDFHAAGELLLKKTARVDLAEAMFARGWRGRAASLRGANNALPCAKRLLALYAVEPLGPFWKLLGEVEGWLAEPGQHASAADVTGHVLNLADGGVLLPHRQSLMDRCRMTLARKLHEHAQVESRMGDAVSVLFGQSRHWSPAVVADATFALKRKPVPKPVERPVRWVRFGGDDLQATTFALRSDEIVMAFGNGKVVVYRPSREETRTFPAYLPDTIGLAVSDDGRHIVALTRDDSSADGDRYTLHVYARNEGVGTYQRIGDRSCQFAAATAVRLMPHLGECNEGPVVWLSTTRGMQIFHGTTLYSPPATYSDEVAPLTDAIFTMLTRYKQDLDVQVDGSEVGIGPNRVSLGWTPARPAGWVGRPTVSFLRASPSRFEIAGVGEGGWVRHSVFESDFKCRAAGVPVEGGFAAVALWQSDRVVAVTNGNRVMWLWRRGANGFVNWAPPTTLDIEPKAVAVVPIFATNEVAVLCQNGDIARVPFPA